MSTIIYVARPCRVERPVGFVRMRTARTGLGGRPCLRQAVPWNGVAWGVSSGGDVLAAAILPGVTAPTRW